MKCFSIVPQPSDSGSQLPAPVSSVCGCLSDTALAFWCPLSLASCAHLVHQRGWWRVSPREVSPGAASWPCPRQVCSLSSTAAFQVEALPAAQHPHSHLPPLASLLGCLSLSLSRMRSQLFKEGTGRSSLPPSASRSHPDADTCLWASRAEDCSLPRLQHIGEGERRVHLYESSGEPP